MVSITKILADNVRTFRSERGWSQADLSERANLSLTAVAHIETERQWPGPETVAKLAKALEVSQSRLFVDPESVRSPTVLEALEAIALANDQEIRPKRRRRTKKKPDNAG